MNSVLSGPFELALGWNFELDEFQKNENLETEDFFHSWTEWLYSENSVNSNSIPCRVIEDSISSIIHITSNIIEQSLSAIDLPWLDRCSNFARSTWNRIYGIYKWKIPKESKNHVVRS